MPIPTLPDAALTCNLEPEISMSPITSKALLGVVVLLLVVLVLVRANLVARRVGQRHAGDQLFRLLQGLLVLLGKSPLLGSLELLGGGVAAAPPLLPPGVRMTSQGLLVRPYTRLSVS